MKTIIIETNHSHRVSRRHFRGIDCGRNCGNVADAAAEYDAKWGGFVIDGKTFTGLVFAGV